MIFQSEQNELQITQMLHLTLPHHSPLSFHIPHLIFISSPSSFSSLNHLLQIPASSHFPLDRGFYFLWPSPSTVLPNHLYTSHSPNCSRNQVDHHIPLSHQPQVTFNSNNVLFFISNFI